MLQQLLVSTELPLLVVVLKAANFRRIYIKINNKEELKESEIPEFYTTNSSGTITKAELLVSGLDYNLGKRNYSDSSPEAVYAFLPATPTDASSKLFGTRLRARDASIDPAVTQNSVSTKNDVRSFYAWEYSQTVSGEDLGRVCLLVADQRAGGSSTISGIPQTFNVTLNGTNQYNDILTTSTVTVDAKLSNSSGTDVTPTTQSSPIKVRVTVDGTSKQITNVAIFQGTNGNAGNLQAGQGFAVGNNLRLLDGVGTALGTRTGSGPVVISVATITSETGVSFAPGNNKPEGYIPFSSIGARYAPIDENDPLTSQSASELSLLRRLTQRVDTSGDNQTSDGTDQFEFDSNTTANIYIKRITDDRNNFGDGELVWRAIYKMPKGTSGSQELKPPEARFTLQLRDNAATYPFTYDGSNNFPKSYYIYRVETLIDYKYTQRDGYYLLTLLMVTFMLRMMVLVIPVTSVIPLNMVYRQHLVLDTQLLILQSLVLVFHRISTISILKLTLIILSGTHVLLCPDIELM